MSSVESSSLQSCVALHLNKTRNSIRQLEGKTKQDKRMRVLQPAWLSITWTKCLHTFYTSSYTLSHSQKTWLPQELQHSQKKFLQLLAIRKPTLATS